MLSSVLFAGNYEDGMKAYKEKDFEKAIELFSKSSKNDNDSRSTRNLGLMYIYGQGFEINNEKGIEFLKKASAKGDAFASKQLGDMSASKKDFKEAAIWFEKAANLGDLKSMTNLAYLYTYGDGVKKNFETAFSWYEKSASLGNIDAQINISFLYISGQGVKKDMKKAAFWAKKVKDTGDERIDQIWEQFQLKDYL